MALERILAPSILDSHFFDDIFDEMNQEIYRLHHDLRHGMMRLTPRDPISGDGDRVSKHLKSLRECIVSKDDGTQEFRLNVDMNAFKPEEIEVKTAGDVLNIKAKHEEKTEESAVIHEFSRSYTLPEDVDPEALVCSLSRDGVMTVKGPVATIEAPPEKKKKEAIEEAQEWNGQVQPVRVPQNLPGTQLWIFGTAEVSV